MPKHTPGPWALVETTMPDIVSGWHIQIGEQQITFFPFKHVWSEDRTASGLVTDHQVMADARLIAAAPDLLASLQWALDAMAARNPMWTEGENFIAARAAIAKATGGQDA